MLFVDTNNMEDNDSLHQANIELCILSQRSDNDEIYIIIYILN